MLLYILAIVYVLDTSISSTIEMYQLFSLFLGAIGEEWVRRFSSNSSTLERCIHLLFSQPYSFIHNHIHNLPSQSLE